MVVSTEISNYAFVNVGPLTATYTAPASCSTDGGWTALAQTDYSLVEYYRLDCEDIKLGNCYPGGESQEKVAKALTKTNPPVYQAFQYHSPGLYCPDRWTTAAIASKDSEGEVVTSGEIYAMPNTTATAEVPSFNPPEHVFLEGLQKGETAALCCPTGYTAAPGVALCVSPLPTSAIKSAKTVCQVIVEDGVTVVPATFTYNGHTITGEEISDTKPTRSLTTSYATLVSDFLQDNDLAPYTYMPMVTLVHKAEDKKKATEVKTGTDTKNGAEQGDDEGDAEDDDRNSEVQATNGDDGRGDENEDEEDAANLDWNATKLMATVWGIATVVTVALLA